MKIYSEQTRIKSYYVDKNGLVSTSQIFNFFQEAAYRHSVNGYFGQPDLAELDLVWMLSRMKVVVFKNALIGEEVEIKSWVRSIKGTFSERDFEITLRGQVVVKATSLWVCLQINPVKPVPIPPQIVNKMNVQLKNTGLSTTKIAAIKGEVQLQKYTILPSDIDMVGHTNNVAYIRMVMDANPPPKKLKSIEVNYLLQSFLNDIVSIKTQKTDGQAQIYEVANDKGEVVCRIKTGWG